MPFKGTLPDDSGRLPQLSGRLPQLIGRLSAGWDSAAPLHPPTKDRTEMATHPHHKVGPGDIFGEMAASAGNFIRTATRVPYWGSFLGRVRDPL